MKIPCIVRGSIPLKNTISSWKPLRVLCTQISFQGPVQWDAGGIPRNGRSTPQGSKGGRAPCVLKARAQAALSRPPLPMGEPQILLAASAALRWCMHAPLEVSTQATGLPSRGTSGRPEVVTVTPGVPPRSGEGHVCARFGSAGKGPQCPSDITR